MPSLNVYVQKPLIDELDHIAQIIERNTGVRPSRSALVSAALRQYVFSSCLSEEKKDDQSDNTQEQK